MKNYFHQNLTGKTIVEQANKVSSANPTSTFLNECSSEGFMTSPPTKGQGQWKKYNELQLVEFSILCILKTHKVKRSHSRDIMVSLRHWTKYHSSRSINDLKENLGHIIIALKDRQHLRILKSHQDLLKLLEPPVSRTKSITSHKTWAKSPTCLIILVVNTVMSELEI